MQHNQNWKTGAVNIIRWIVILPCSILAFLTIRGLFNFLIYLVWSDGNPLFFKYITPLIITSPAGYIATGVGKYIAPIYKKHTALGLLILSSTIAGIGITLYFLLNKISAESLLELIGLLTGCIIAFIKINNDIELI